MAVGAGGMGFSHMRCVAAAVEWSSSLCLQTALADCLTASPSAATAGIITAIMWACEYHIRFLPPRVVVLGSVVILACARPRNVVQTIHPNRPALLPLQTSWRSPPWPRLRWPNSTSSAAEALIPSQQRWLQIASQLCCFDCLATVGELAAAARRAARPLRRPKTLLVAELPLASLQLICTACRSL